MSVLRRFGRREGLHFLVSDFMTPSRKTIRAMRAKAAERARRAYVRQELPDWRIAEAVADAIDFCLGEKDWKESRYLRVIAEEGENE